MFSDILLVEDISQGELFKAKKNMTDRSELLELITAAPKLVGVCRRLTPCEVVGYLGVSSRQ